MYISNRKNFTRRVKLPTIALLIVTGFYIGVFANVYYCGYPVTLIVSGMFFVSALAIAESIKQEDKA